MKNYFDVGQLVINKRYDNHTEHLYRYVVRKRKDLLEVIIPFFQKYPLHTSKSKDFRKFVECIELIDQGVHKTRNGLIDILEIAQTMNRKKPRTELIRILRD